MRDKDGNVARTPGTGPYDDTDTDTDTDATPPATPTPPQPTDAPADSAPRKPRGRAAQ